jgi:hypothetical protein
MLYSENMPRLVGITLDGIGQSSNWKYYNYVYPAVIKTTSNKLLSTASKNKTVLVNNHHIVQTYGGEEAKSTQSWTLHQTEVGGQGHLSNRNLEPNGRCEGCGKGAMPCSEDTVRTQ